MNVWVYGHSAIFVEAVAAMLRGYHFRAVTAADLPKDANVALWVAESRHNGRLPPPAHLPTLVLMDADDDLVIELLAHGYRGHIASDAEPTRLRDALRAVAGGAIWAPREAMAHALFSSIALPGVQASPTPREREVMALLSRAMSNRAIAERLGITERTVKAHVSSLLVKYQAKSRVELVVNARRAEKDSRRPGPGAHSRP